MKKSVRLATILSFGVLMGGLLVLKPVKVLAESNVGASYGARPANENPDNPRSKSIFIYDLNFGQSKKDAVILTNQTDKEIKIDLYATDGLLTNTGAFTCKQRADKKEQVGTWIKLSKEQVTIPASGETKVDFDVTIPQKTDVGEHNGCIVYEASDSKPSGEGGVQIKTRQAIRLVNTIPGDLKREVSIESLNVTKGGSFFAPNERYDVTLKSEGNVSADTDIKVYVKNLFGLKVEEYGGTYPVIAKSSYLASFENFNLTNTSKPYIWGGFYRVSSEIKYDKTPSRLAGLANLKDGEIVSKKTDDKIIFIMPAWYILLLYIGILLALGYGAYIFKFKKKK